MKSANHLENSLLKRHYQVCGFDHSTSRLDTSVFSSTCGETTILQSLKKIDELKKMYEQTMQQRAVLMQHREGLKKDMSKARSEMVFLIESSFRNNKKVNVLQEDYSPQKQKTSHRAGSIGKIVSPRKLKEENQISEFQGQATHVEIQNVHIDLKQNEEFLPQALQNQIMEEQGYTKKTHKKIISNLEFSAYPVHKDSTIRTQKKLNRQSARKSTELIKCHMQVSRLWEDKNNGFERKSYLSPRSSFLRGSFDDKGVNHGNL